VPLLRCWGLQQQKQQLHPSVCCCSSRLLKIYKRWQKAAIKLCACDGVNKINWFMHRDEKYHGKKSHRALQHTLLGILQSCYSKREIMEYLIRLRSRFCACPRWKFTATTTQRRVTATIPFQRDCELAS
jgi:hypothetical protein